jgi:hypothetical protein
MRLSFAYLALTGLAAVLAVPNPMMLRDLAGITEMASEQMLHEVPVMPPIIRSSALIHWGN